jgi:hypothetical protein
MDLKAFRRDVLAKTTELKGTHLSGYLYLTSVDNRERQISAGTVTEVTLQNAARHLCERSHVISTPEEIESYRQRCEENRAQISASLKRNTDRELTITTTRK